MRISDWSSAVCSSDLVRSCGTVKRRFCGAGRKANAMLDFLSRHNPRGLVARFIAAPAALTVFLVLYGTLGIGQAQTPEDGCDASAPANIQVTVEKVRSSEGLITAVLYADNPETFLKKGARLDRIRVDAREGETTLCLDRKSTRLNSVALYHDENGKKQFNKEFPGIQHGK